MNILTDGENIVLGDFGLVKNLNKENLLISELDDSEAEDILNASDTMPRFYRTPELVRFAKKEDILRIESDTFQMGLVFTDLFMKKIQNLIQQMLNVDYNIRATPEYILQETVSIIAFI